MKYSPWGAIQSTHTLADGALFVTTAGHGGVKLDRRRNAAIPAPARSAGGWYEEDCQWAIPAFVHKDIGQAMLATDSAHILVETLRSWQSSAVLEALARATGKGAVA